MTDRACPHDQPYATHVDIVAKLGGGVLAYADQFATALAVIGEAAAVRRILIVPGGGPFADAVRDVARRMPVSDDAAHWMAILGMDQHAQLIAARLPGARLVDDPAQIGPALDAQRVPVLAPYRWIRAADPLPHSWDVTSDSIAAWICGAIGAPGLVLVKPPGAHTLRSGRRSALDGTPAPSRAGLVDEYFARALPGGISVTVVTAGHLDRFDAALRGTTVSSIEQRAPDAALVMPS